MSLSCKTKVNKATNSAVISINLRTPKEFTLRLVSFAKENVWFFFSVSSIHSLKVSLLCHSYLPFAFLCLRNVHCFFSMPVIFLRPGQTLAAFQRNILQYCWAKHVAHVCPPCCDMLQHVGRCCIKFENGQIFRARFWILMLRWFGYVYTTWLN